MAEAVKIDVADCLENISRIVKTCDMNEAEYPDPDFHGTYEQRIPAHGFIGNGIQWTGIIRVESSKARTAAGEKPFTDRQIRILFQ